MEQEPEIRKPAKLGASNRARKFRALIVRDGDVCHYCGSDLDDETRSLDHVVPRSKGGPNALVNLVLACKRCNSERGDMDYEEFVLICSYIHGEREERLTYRPFAHLAGVAQFGQSA